MLKSEINEAPSKTFLHFAYGTNLHEKTLHMHTPSAQFVSIGRLDDYRLDFFKYSKFWGGPTMTMVPTANAHIWGAIWRIDCDDMYSLDDQKLVDIKKYFPLNVTIQTPYMGAFLCRTYQQKINPHPRADNDPIPIERWPSATYMKIMIKGARECGIPEYYIDFLKSLTDNGEEGMYRLNELCIRYGTLSPCECKVPGRFPRKPLKLDVRKLRNTTPIRPPGERKVKRKKPL